MFDSFIVILAVAVVFYGLLPVVAALSLRFTWRRFRLRVEALAGAPILSYAAVAGLPSAGSAGRLHRLYGRLEAIEGSNRLWLRGAGITALVDLSASPLYILSSDEAAAPWSPESAGTVERMDWSAVHFLSEGTKLFVGGLVRAERGLAVFSEAPGEPLVAILYDGPESELLSRLVAGGRRRNEYWNAFTPAALAMGVGLSSVLLFLSGRAGVLPSVRALSFLVAAAPLLPLLPPGLFLFFAYRRLWRGALSLRMRRDLLRLPLRRFPDAATVEVPLPNGGGYRRRRLAPGEALPPGFAPLLPSLGAEAGRVAGWTLFEPVGGEDPAAERVATVGDPEELARRCESRAWLSIVGAALALALALALNYALAFVAWRLLAG